MVRLLKLLQMGRGGGTILDGIRSRYQEGAPRTPCAAVSQSASNGSKLIIASDAGHLPVEGSEASTGSLCCTGDAETPADVKSGLQSPSSLRSDAPTIDMVLRAESAKGRHDFRLMGERDVRDHQGQLRLLYKAALVGVPVAHAVRCSLATLQPFLATLSCSAHIKIEVAV